MHYQYHCACCDRIVASGQKICSECGSQNIKTPYGFWLFCLAACLVVALVFKAVHIYLQDHQSIPVQKTFLDSLNERDKNQSD